MVTQTKYIDSPFSCRDGHLECSDHAFTVLRKAPLTREEKLEAYYYMLRQPFIKLCRLRFLNPDYSTAFSVDNNALNKKSGAFIADGTLTVNLQNGARRSLSVKFANVDEEFSYKVNKLWYGTKIALDEGLILPNGEEFYIQQGVFVLTNPEETVSPAEKSISYSLADKWANIDGTLYGNLEGTYEVPVNSHIFRPITSLFKEDRGNGEKVDPTTPVFTNYYNDKTQTAPDGTVFLFTQTPYTLTLDGDSGTIADVVTGLSTMLNAWVGYDSSGALRIEASQDDILDSDKAVLWEFREDETVLLGLTYSYKNTEVYNDYIVVGEQMDDFSQPCGRAQNLDPASDTNIKLIGRKTFRESKPEFSTDTMCKDYAVWKMKRAAALQKAVTISCGQLFHIQENSLVTIIRSDKEGSPAERHLIVGFSRPLASTGAMSINAVSVNDFPNATITGWPK